MFRALVVLQTCKSDRAAERGAAATEYALMVSLVVIAVLVSVTGLGTETASSLHRTASELGS